MVPTGIAELRRSLRLHASQTDARFLQRFFKTGPGQNAEGDRFLGVRVPATRAVARTGRGMPFGKLSALLRSKWHEERLLALIMLGDAHSKADEATREAILRMYLENTAHINNWDLVDTSAPGIVGPHIDPARPLLLQRLARSRDLWERRIAIVATLHWIRLAELRPTFKIATMLVDDSHDLIHKATGWMLREAGKQDREALEGFLRLHCRTMPRTMLRYAIERFPPSVRKRYLAGDA
ncbi:MAG: DNA alkylation repair protein [Anaerolineae bacterium]|nr:DNA alkylation repair protein [Gemmatimonadaceae bacterium]